MHTIRELGKVDWASKDTFVAFKWLRFVNLAALVKVRAEASDGADSQNEIHTKNGLAYSGGH